jgi:hypothetical protein
MAGSSLKQAVARARCRSRRAVDNLAVMLYFIEVPHLMLVGAATAATVAAQAAMTK